MISLTTDQITRFREQGYCAFPNFYSEHEVAAMRSELARLRTNGLLRNVAADGDGKTTSQTVANLQLSAISPHSPLFRAMPFDEKVIAVTRQLIGDPVVLHLDQVYLKPGGYGSGTAWHQDNAYFKIANPLQGTAMWTAVHEATVANGTLHLIPRSFRELLPHSRDPNSVRHIRCYPDETGAIPIELPAGGVVFFAYGTTHCTRDNNTEHDRAGVAFHFLNASAIGPSFSYTGDPMKHPYLTGHLADGGLTAYGVRIAGTWEHEVAQANGFCLDSRPDTTAAGLRRTVRLPWWRRLTGWSH